MKTLTDEEIITLYHLVNLSDQEFEDSIEGLDPYIKQEVKVLHFKNSLSLFNKVQEEVNTRNEEVKQLTTKAEFYNV